MFIQPVLDDEGGKKEGEESANVVEENFPVDFHHQTASELFDIMSRNHTFDSGGVDSLTARDLIILYKNIDLGTKLMSSANEFKRRKPNQYVETVVYNDDPETDSDVSEIFSNEDLHNVILVNKERIDLLTNQVSLENTLCHKNGDIEMKTTNLNSIVDKNFLFKNSFIKEQLNSLSLMTNPNENIGSMLPSSLLDYMCCKRLEDNYNFYMDDIIKYVKHTIEQLKRISNGDFLTEKVKEKWKEVENIANVSTKENKAKQLVSSTSMPLHVERKKSRRNVSTWDDIVHSEVDIRYLSKILEKKLRFEIPKMICGSYKLFSKYSRDNLIVSCVKEKTTQLKESRVDVVFKLERSDSGHVISNINSVIVLQAQEISSSEVLPLAYGDNHAEKNKNDKKLEEADNELTNSKNKPENTNTELINTKNELANTNKELKNTICELKCDESTNFKSVNLVNQKHDNADDYDANYDAGTSNAYGGSQSDFATSDSSNTHDPDMFNRSSKSNTEIPFNMQPSDELRLAIQRLNMPTTLPEENNEENSEKLKKKSPPRPRIKSPYENSSFIIEEKKRKKLLEIRERRERKKMAMSEHCKVIKPKYNKDTIMPQPSNSVTKLSITNKSFYNSIYGQSTQINIDHKIPKSKEKRSIILSIPSKTDLNISDTEEADNAENKTTNNSDSNKYDNRSYYLNDTVTEMMYLDMKKDKEEQHSETTSTNDMYDTLKTPNESPNILKISHVQDVNIPIPEHQTLNESLEKDDVIKYDDTKLSPQYVKTGTGPPVNTPRITTKLSKKTSATHSTIEFRKSIDKLYDLMKHLGKTEGTDIKHTKSKFTTSIGQESVHTIQCSDSGTSLKHHLTSSNPSYYSFEKNNNESQKESPKNIIPIKNENAQKLKQPTNVVPKVIITAKTSKAEVEKNKNIKRKVINASMKVDNPLKAISQLLHDMDHVQKTRHKSANESYPSKKADVTNTEVKPYSRQNINKNKVQQNPKDSAPYFTRTKERKPKLGYMTGDSPRIGVYNDDKYINKSPRKHVSDIVDEYKEAKGEAVRGPSKWNARLNSLAQPKKSYVQATIEECQTRYGKNMVPERLHRLAAAPPQAAEKPRPISGKRKLKKPFETVSSASPRPPPCLERVSKRNPAGNKPEPVYNVPANETSYKQRSVAEKPGILRKMVAVESYVKNHYGQSSTPAGPTRLLLDGFPARVPILPSDIVLDESYSSSPCGDESSTIAKKLHNMLDSLITTTNPNLPIVTEGTEPTTKDMDDDCKLSQDTNSLKQNDSDFNNNDTTNRFDDPQDSLEDYDRLSDVKSVQAFKSDVELEKLETALHRRLSVSTFHKRLRIKNLTITPKQSVQQVLLLQSGDIGSLFVKKSTAALEVVKSNCSSAPTNVSVGWDFSKVPMQIATVGYAFPIHSAHNNNNVSEKILQIESNHESITNAIQKCSAASLCQEFVTITNMFHIDPIVALNETLTTPSDDHKLLERTFMTSELCDSEFRNVQQHEESELYHIESGCNQLSEVDSSVNCTEQQKSLQESGNSDKIKNVDISLTSSLDILAGLLNEIQKITTCQSQIAKVESGLEDYQSNEKLPANCINGTEKSESLNEAREIISISSLEKLRHLESPHSSIISCYLSNDGERLTDFSDIITSNLLSNFLEMPCSIPKRQKAPEKVYVHQCTDNPSFTPINVNRSTNVSNSLIGVLSQPSNNSIVSYSESYYHDTTLVTRKNIIELPSKQREIQNASCVPQKKKMSVKTAVQGVQVDKIKSTVHDKKIQKSVTTTKKTTKSVVVSNKPVDPIMKMKRDVLVTMYSILVFTVFVALSFPDLYPN